MSVNNPEGSAINLDELGGGQRGPRTILKSHCTVCKCSGWEPAGGPNSEDDSALCQKVIAITINAKIYCLHSKREHIFETS